MMHHSLHLILTNMLIYFPTGGPLSSPNGLRPKVIS